MNSGSQSSNRFRKSGLTRSLNAAAVCTAKAAIFFTDNVNMSVDVTDPSYQYRNVLIVNREGLQLYTSFDDKSGQQDTAITTIGSEVAANSFRLLEMGSGVPVNASLVYALAGRIVNPNQASGWLTRGDSGYFGFRFNPSGSLPLYGWAQLIRSATGTDTVTFTKFAYEDSGAAILTGATAVPEPEDYAVAVGAGLLALAGVRRWRRRR